MPMTTPADLSSDAARGLRPAWRVEVFRRAPFDAAEGERLVRALEEIGVAGLRGVRRGRGYLLSPELERAAVERIVAELLADPVLDEVRIAKPAENPPASGRAAHRILVRRRPGVMDPVANTIERAIARARLASSAEDAPARALTFQVFELEGSLDRASLRRAAYDLLANDVVDDVSIDDERLDFALPSGAASRAVGVVRLRDAGEDELARISRDGTLSLSLSEMRAIRAHYREQDRDPTACELETIAQTWSEHCKHKTFTGRIDFDGEIVDNLLESTIAAATRELARPWCVSVFHDNAGVIAFDEAWHVCFKVETHNHPSAIDPYGGAGTGIGGVIRDILGVGLGAKPIANTDAFFVGPLDAPGDLLPPGSLHPRRILRGVVAGVRDYGNRMGIPTVSGGLWIDPGYVGNPLVYAGTVGLMPAGCEAKRVEAGDWIVVAGGRTGRDGIHGATFSSAELHEESATTASAAVQIGDPITEKRLLDALIAARDRRLFRAVTDCGAGGLSSAVGEMSEGHGAEVWLERVPLKYPGLAPDEVWISEAQERMVFAVPPENLEALRAVFEAEDCESSVIGQFTSTGRLRLTYDGATVGDLDLHFLHRGTPRPLRKATRPRAASDDPGVPACPDVAGEILALVGGPNSRSREWIVRQYDHEVQGMSVVKSVVGARERGPSDAAVLQPLSHSRRGIALACGANPRYGALDPWAMASAVIDEALRNVVCVGGDPARAAILDNFSWGNCEKPEQLGALVLAARACYTTAVAFGTPFISGKDSLNNEYRSRGESVSIPPTLYVSALAIVPDVARAVTMDLKRAGDFVYAVGMTHAELGGSEYLGRRGLAGGRVPRPDLELGPRTLAALHRAISSGLVRACHDLSEGGLAVAAAEMVLAGELGLEIELDRIPCTDGGERCDRDTLRLFSESCTRFLVEVEPERAAAFEAEFAGLDCARAGRVVERAALAIRGVSGAQLADLTLDAIARAHCGGFAG
jgi:phosphoribosylformylglycinamidine synthase